MERRLKRAFTLIELLVVIAVIAILAALIFPVLSSTEKRANRITCVNNLRQINTAVLMYAHDNVDTLPLLPVPDPYPTREFFYYKELVKGYVGLSGPPQPYKLFICPSEAATPTDGLLSTAYGADYTDYCLNIWLVDAKLTSIKHPGMTVLVAEHPAYICYSWHQPQSKYVLVNNAPNGPPHLAAAYNNVMNEVAYVDGHINYIKIYNDGITESAIYNPAPGYDYQWSGD